MPAGGGRPSMPRGSRRSFKWLFLFKKQKALAFERPAAVDHEIVSRNVAGVVRGQIANGIGHFLSCSKSSEGDRIADDFFRFFIGPEIAVSSFARKWARCNCIQPDVVLGPLH